MNKKDQRSAVATSTLLKLIAAVYIVVFAIFLIKEYLFDNADSGNHAFAIIGGIILLIVAIPLIISSIRGIGDQRAYVQKHGNRMRMPDGEGTTVYSSGNLENASVKHSKNNSSKKKKKKKR